LSPLQPAKCAGSLRNSFQLAGLLEVEKRSGCELLAQLSGNAECATLLHSKVRLPRNWNPPQMSLSVMRVWRLFSCDSSMPGK
jgi:hypothetical protein